MLGFFFLCRHLTDKYGQQLHILCNSLNEIQPLQSFLLCPFERNFELNNQAGINANQFFRISSKAFNFIQYTGNITHIFKFHY